MRLEITSRAQMGWWSTVINTDAITNAFFIAPAII